MANQANHYDAGNIQVLEGLEAVRMRPGMYIGTTSTRGLHHLLWEIVDNAIDEASNGFADEVRVTLHTDGSASVYDNGRGMPVDEHPTMHVSGAEVIFTVLHAGGKFNNENYSYSGGLHGVGASVVNALSKWLTVDIYRDFSHYAMRFTSQFDEKKGKVIAGKPDAPLAKVGNTRKKGTLVRFLPDDAIFEDVRFNYDTVFRRLQELAYLNRGLKIVFLDERVSDPARRETTFHYEGGIIDYVRYLNDGKTVLHDQPIYLEGQKDSVICRVAIQYTDGYTESLFSYVNNIPTGEGGTHETGFKAAFTKMFNDYARRNGFLKEKDSNLTGEDFREGLSCVLTTMVKNPQFEGQTKGRLGNSEVRPAVEGIITQQLTDWLENLKNQEIAQQIVQKAIRAAQVREAARKTRDNARKANQLDAAPLVGKLSACRGKKAEDNELFIVEGDSAGGSAKQGRDSRYQAILPLLGAECRKETAGSGAEQRGVPLADYRARHIHRRKFQPCQPQIQQGHHPLRCRSGRRAHPRHSAHFLLPLHEGACHRRSRLYRNAAAVQGAKGQQGSLCLRRQGAGEVHQGSGQRLHAPALQRPGRNEPRTTLGDDDGSFPAQTDAGDD